MDPKILSLVMLRGLALALGISGQTRASNSLYTLADAVERGVNVDSHMALVAEKMKTRGANEQDWIDVADRIEADSARLQGS